MGVSEREKVTGINNLKKENMKTHVEAYCLTTQVKKK